MWLLHIPFYHNPRHWPEVDCSRVCRSVVCLRHRYSSLNKSEDLQVDSQGLWCSFTNLAVGACLAFIEIPSFCLSAIKIRTYLVIHGTNKWLHYSSF